MFYSGKMVSDQIDAALTNAVLEAKVKDGSLIVLGALAADTTYDANGLEYDLYEGAQPGEDDTEFVIVDYAGISEGEIGGNIYREGIKLYDLEVPAGTPTRVRRLHLHDKFWLSEDMFESAPTVGKFAVAKASSYKHDPKTSAQTGYCIKILLKKDLTAGMKTIRPQYLCEVISL